MTKYVCPNCKSNSAILTERRINGNSHCSICYWRGPTKELIFMEENDKIKDLYEACLEKDRQIILVMEGKISLLTEENKALKKIIVKELSENDELGREYTYVTCLKAEITQLKSELSIKDKYISDIHKMIDKVDSLTKNETDFSIESLMYKKKELSNFVKDLHGRNET